MQFKLVAKTMGILLFVFSFTHLPPIIVDFIYQELHYHIFLLSFFITLLCGVLLWLPVRHNKREFRVREGVLVVVLFWCGLSLFGTIPFLLLQADHTSISFTDAFFESMSALTTTGATIIPNLEVLPKSLLYYRQQLQWLGGMGIIVLAVAILPMLGVGGIQLYNAEKKSVHQGKLMPRIKETAMVLWSIYLMLTIIAAIAYYLAGMDIFDAISHSFSTVAIGGFSTHNESLSYFNNHHIETVAIIFMFLSGVNFALHFFAWRSGSLMPYLKDSEFKAYALYLLLLIILVTVIIWHHQHFSTMGETLRHVIFQVVSIATTTGFVSNDFHNWPASLAIFLLFASFIGACVGSTGGGLKVVRVLLLFKQAMNEIKRFIHPNSSNVLRLGTTSLSDSVIVSIWGFASLYAFVFIVIMIILLITGLDIITAFSATAASINNLGPGLGEVKQSYQSINDFAKWVLSFAMLLGRLEVLTLVALFHRAFWRF